VTAAVLAAFQYRCAESGEAAREAVECYAASGFEPGASVTLRAYWPVFGPVPLDDAIDLCHAVIVEAQTPVWVSFVLPFLALAEGMGGRFDDARAHLAEARIGREEFADQGTIVTSWSDFAAQVELLADEPRRAEEILAPTIEVLRAGDDVSWLATNSAWLGEALYRQGRVDEALLASELAMKVSPRGYLTSLSVAGRVQAKALARVGRVGEAREVVARTAALVAPTDALSERGEVLAALAEVLAIAGDDEAAKAAADEATALFEQKGSVISAARVRDVAAGWGKPA
jgi:tetratricopeptide (TPR) repeat protein